VTTWRRDPDGWAPLYRRLLRSAAWKGHRPTTKIVAVWVILSVRHIDSSDGPPGSVYTEVERIGRECDLTENTARRALRELQDRGVIKVSRRNHGIVITMCSFRKWCMGDDISESDEGESRAGPNANGDLAERKVSVPDISGEVEEGSSVRRNDSQKRAAEPSANDALSPEKPAKLEGYRETTDAFQNRYEAAYEAKPTWGAREGAQLKRLLAAHGATEVQSRIERLFSSPPRWIDPPFTFMTLVRHFDSLVPVSARPQAGRRDGGLSVAEIMEQAARMRAR